MTQYWITFCRPSLINTTIEALPLIAWVHLSMMEMIMVGITIHCLLNWAIATAVTISMSNLGHKQKQRSRTIIEFPNWLKAWGGHSIGRDYTTGIRPRSYYRGKTKRRPQQIGHKIPHQTTHHIKLYTAVAWKATSSTIRNKSPHQTTHSFDSDSYSILVDCGATMSITNNRSDFTGKTTKGETRIRGISGISSSNEQGIARWKVEDDHGKTHEILVPALLDTRSPHRLWSPQHWAQHIDDKTGTSCTINGSTLQLRSDKLNFVKTITLDRQTNVAMIRSSPGFSKYAKLALQHDEARTISAYPSIIPYDDGEVDITRIPTESTIESPPAEGPEPKTSVHTPTTPGYSGKIDFHDEIPHPNTTESELDDPQQELLRWHMRLGHLPFGKIQQLAELDMIPKQLRDCKHPICTGCMYGKATRQPWRTRANHNKIGTRVPITRPGQCVSIDQLESSTPGLIGQVKGWLTRDRFKVATVFVDHYSNMSYVHCQRTTSDKETLEAKHAFENFADTHGVRVRHYHADNGRFAENKFLQDINLRNQSISFSGVNAHWQNGVAEKRIRDVQDSARAMILQAKTMWPAAISAHLWPYAIRAANDGISLGIPKGKQNTRIELFSGSRVSPKTRNYHTFGCPAYVLDSRLQAGKKINKWESRARLGINLGHSPKHARSVSLILNPTTGLVSPQFHIKFDDLFETVRGSVDPSHAQWKTAAGFDRKETTQGPRNSRRSSMDNTDTRMRTPETGGLTPQETTPDVQQTTGPNLDLVTEETEQRVTRSGRRAKETSRYREYRQTLAATACTTDLEECLFSPSELDDPLAFAASSDPDTLYYNQAMKQPDKEQFIEAMEKEITDHTTRRHWTIIPRSEVPRDAKILPSVWSMKRKRRVDTGEVYKHKSRLNVHGGKQVKGIDYNETYAPVVQWVTIRMILILGLLYGWYTLQLDYILAFPQAEIDMITYMEIPKGIEVQHGRTEDYVLRLDRNLYGRCQAPRVWGQHRDKGLQDLGFVQSKIDECMFYKNNTILLVYVDDAILTGPDKLEIEQIYDEMDTIFDISYEGDISDYLGVHITRTDQGKLELTQRKLIDTILKDMNILAETKTRKVPAKTSVLLTKGENKEPHKATWKYRSIIGKLNFLEKSTRPDIAYAVHNCARFMENPRENHTAAITDIVRYLKGTRDKGIIYHPDSSKGIEVFVDSNFVGDWDAYLPELDRDSARSRYGFFINIAGCPLIWGSRLATEISLGSTEAEFTGLSYALREAIPLIEIAKEIGSEGFKISTEVPKVHCKVFEDNTGAIELARLPKVRQRTKHINVRLYHFSDVVCGSR